jgi:hypothetical protein
LFALRRAAFMSGQIGRLADVTNATTMEKERRTVPASWGLRKVL